MPEGWQRLASRTHPGRQSYRNQAWGVTFAALADVVELEERVRRQGRVKLKSGVVLNSVGGIICSSSATSGKPQPPSIRAKAAPEADAPQHTSQAVPPERHHHSHRRSQSSPPACRHDHLPSLQTEPSGMEPVVQTEPPLQTEPANAEPPQGDPPRQTETPLDSATAGASAAVPMSTSSTLVTTLPSTAAAAASKRRDPPGWERLESRSRPGCSSYINQHWGFRLPSLASVARFEERLRQDKIAEVYTAEGAKYTLSRVGPLGRHRAVIWANTKFVTPSGTSVAPEPSPASAPPSPAVAGRASILVEEDSPADVDDPYFTRADQ